jgi:LPS-assembly lipoprotein
MWWREVWQRAEHGAGRMTRIAGVIGVSALLAGCFQPLYGDRSLTGGSTVHAELAQVDIAQIPAKNDSAEARIAVEVRNQLVFGFNGGGAAPPPNYRLNIRIASTRLSVIVDINTARPDVENFGLNAYYELIDLKTGKVVVRDSTFSRVSYDIPGQEQRFARARGLRDAETRAAKVVADNVQARIASYFIGGT